MRGARLHVRSAQQDLAAVSGSVGCQVVASILVHKLVAELQHQCGVCAHWAVKADGELAILPQVAIADIVSCTCTAL